MENKELKGKDEAEKILTDMTQKFELDKMESIIKDNKIDFTLNDKQYRVRLLSLRDKEELDELRRKKFTQLLKDKDVVFEENLIKLYKEKGIDINSIKDEINKLENERITIELKLGEALSKNSGDAILKAYKEEIEKNNYLIQIKLIQKSDLLAYSFENQLLNYVAKLIAYLSLDILENDKYKRLFNTIEEFDNCEDEKLIGLSTKYALLLQYC
jgi:hypothetical protein